MTLYPTGTARIRHATTGVIYTIQSSDLDWDETADEEERGMGFQVHHNGYLDHPDLGQLNWYIAEYPAGAINDTEVDIGPHHMVETFDSDGGEAHDPQSEARAMVEWFFQNYEDPAHETMWNGREGGFQYAAGGPYDAREELYDQFPNADDAAIDLAVDEIEQDGTVEWAPVRRVNEEDEFYEDDDLEDQIKAALDRLPDQAPGLQFGVGSSGLIGLLQSPAASGADLDEITELKADARQIAADLLEHLQGSNAHQMLKAPVQNYLNALEDNLFSIDRLYTAGLRIENSAARLDDSDLPALPPASNAILTSLLDIHAVMIPSTARGRLLMERASDYARSASDTARLKAQTHALTDAIASAGSIADADAVAALSEAAEELGSGPHPERSTEVAVAASGNFLISLFKQSGGLILSGIVTTGVLASAPGMTATAEVTALSNLGAQFIAAHLELLRAFAATAGSDLNWLNQICHLIHRGRTRAERAD